AGEAGTAANEAPPVFWTRGTGIPRSAPRGCRRLPMGKAWHYSGVMRRSTDLVGRIFNPIRPVSKTACNITGRNSAVALGADLLVRPRAAGEIDRPRRSRRTGRSALQPNHTPPLGCPIGSLIDGDG